MPSGCNYSINGAVATINIASEGNSSELTLDTIKSLSHLVTLFDENEDVRVVVLESKGKDFSSGMSFTRYLADVDDEGVLTHDYSQYYDLLTLITTCSCAVVAHVQGDVNAGGIGLISASDFVIADINCQFSLSEALFEMVPVRVLPFLIRRVGYQKALAMILKTSKISTARASEIGLIDEYSDNSNILLGRYLARLTKIHPNTTSKAKKLIHELFELDSRHRNNLIDEAKNLFSSPTTKTNIRRFVEEGKYPWND